MTQPEETTPDTDGLMNSTEPDRIPASEDYEPPETANISLPLQLSKTELEAAAEEIGMSRVRVRKWSAYSKIGEELEKIGAVRVCAGELLFSNQVRLEAIQKCRRLLSKASNPEVAIQIAEILNEILDSKDASTNMLLKAIQSGAIEKKPEAVDVPRLPPRGVMIAAQSVTVNAAQEKPAG